MGRSSNVPHEAFLRLCRRARTRSGKCGKGKAHLVLSISVPADSPVLLTLARLHTFIYVFRQKAAWSTLGVLTKKKYKSDLTKKKEAMDICMGIKRISYTTLPGLFPAQESQQIYDKIYSTHRVGRQDLQHSSLSSWHKYNVFIPPKSLVSKGIWFITK